MTPLLEAYIAIAGSFFTIFIFVAAFSQKLTVNKMFTGMFLSIFWLGVLTAISILSAQAPEKK